MPSWAYARTWSARWTSLRISGVFGVGTATDPLSPALLERGVHFVVPTLASWGNTSPIPHGVTFHDQLYQDVTALINHLHPNVDDLKLYISGGSLGTVTAQMLYGVPYEKFPSRYSLHSACTETTAGDPSTQQPL